MACLLADHVKAPRDLIARRLGADATSIRFAKHTAAFPWRSHAAWIFSQMMRWGHVPHDADVAKAVECYRPDLFRHAAADVGISAPLVDSKVEGSHADAWALPGSAGPIPMAPDRISDGPEFDPESLRKYAAGFAVTRLTD
jgi:hypothetical protein